MRANPAWELLVCPCTLHRQWFSRALLLIVLSLIAAFSTSLSAFAQEEGELALDDDGEPGIKIQEAREILTRALAPGATREEELRYWAQRERAAFAVGSANLRLEALRRLVDLDKGTPDAQRYWGYLWREERRSGNQQRAFEIGEELMRSKDLTLARRVQNAALLSDDYLAIGNRQRAGELIDSADRLLREYAAGTDPNLLDWQIASVELARSNLLRNEGRYTEAESAVRKALEAATRFIAKTRDRKLASDAPSIYESALRYRHSIYGSYVRLFAETGRHVEAESMARQGLQDAIADQTQGATVGYFYDRIGRAKMAQRRYADAQALFDRSLAVYAKAGLVPSSERVVYARMARVEALLGQDKWAEADADYTALISTTGDDAFARQVVTVPLLRTVLQAMNGRGDEALATIEPSVRFRARLYGEKNPVTLEAKAVRGMALQAQGSTRAALAAYREAFDATFSAETTYAETTGQGLRGFYLSLAWQSYLKLIAEQALNGKATAQLISDAFTVADRFRDSSVQQALIDSAARTLVVNDPQLLALVRAEQDARNAKRDAYNALSKRFTEIRDADLEIKEAADAGRKSTEAQDPARDVAKAQEKRAAALKAVEVLRKQIAGHDEEQRRLRQDLARRFPAYYRLVNPAPVRPADVAKQLAQDEVLVSVYTTRTHTFVWAISARAEPLMHVAPVGTEAIAADVGRLRSTLELGNRATPAPFNFEAAHRLYTIILQPVAKALAGARVMTVVANGALGQIPFAVLVKEPAQAGGYDTAAWLVKDVAIAHVASASAWLSVRDAAGKRAPASPFIGFGDPQFSAQSAAPQEKAVRVVVTRALVERVADQGVAAYDYGVIPPLPETRAEILAMAKSLGADPAISAFFGAAASRARVLSTNMRDYRVVAFATHGLKAGDLPDLSQPALALAATATPGESPLLTLDDVLRLQLAADWVVLSACNTAASDGGSDEAISGLGRGFFFAGARSILVTHWAVESRSAQTLVTNIFEHYAGRAGTTRAQSLREAQIDMISGKTGHSTAIRRSGPLMPSSAMRRSSCPGQQQRVQEASCDAMATTAGRLERLLQAWLVPR